MVSYGEKVRRYLCFNVMSQETLAKEIGVSQKTISRYVNNEVVPSPERRAQINKILRIPDHEPVFDKAVVVSRILKEIKLLDTKQKLDVVTEVLERIVKENKET